MYLITGANGFLGRILVRELSGSVKTLSRTNASYNIDLASTVPRFDASFDVVVHAAGLAHTVPRKREEAEAFFRVNLGGTQNLVRGLTNTPTPPKALIFVSTVAVYGREMGTEITEAHPLSGTSPYALSKIQAEHFLLDWGRQAGVRIAILRLPLIAGPNPPGNLGAMIQGLKSGRYLGIGSGQARKSMVLADDLPPILPILADRGGIYNLTDGYHPSLAELEAAICHALERPLPRRLPQSAAHALAKLGDILGPRFPLNTPAFKKLTQDLTFDDAKARAALGWRPRPVLDHLRINQ